MVIVWKGGGGRRDSRDEVGGLNDSAEINMYT